MRISSRDFYSHHSASFFCQADVVNGHVEELYTEYGREGGAIWSRGGGDCNGSLQVCLSNTGRHFGIKFYAAVVKAADKDRLKSRFEIARKWKRDEIARAKGKLDTAKRAYLRAKRDYEKLKE